MPRSQLSLIKLKLFDTKAASFVFNPDNLGFRSFIFKIWNISGNLDSGVN